MVLTNRRSEAEGATQDEQKAALKRKEVFTDWFLGSILAVQTPEELTTITVVPLSDEEPEYRDDYAAYAFYLSQLV